MVHGRPLKQRDRATKNAGIAINIVRPMKSGFAAYPNSHINKGANRRTPSARATSGLHRCRAPNHASKHNNPAATGQIGANGKNARPISAMAPLAVGWTSHEKTSLGYETSRTISGTEARNTTPNARPSSRERFSAMAPIEIGTTQKIATK